MKEKADEKTMEKVKKKLKDGWIKLTMIIEVLAVSSEAAKSALEKHVKSMEEEEGVIIYGKEWQKVREMDKPLPNIEKGFSTMVELEMLTVNYEKLVFLVMNYGPSNIEILEPDPIKLDLGQAQGIVISVADMLHKFAQMRVGGIVVKS